MTPQAIVERFVTLFPDFRAYWDEPGNCFRDDDGAFTSHGVFAEFSSFFRERYEQLPRDRVVVLGAFVSECVASSDIELADAAALCFLENVAAERFSPDFKRKFSGEALRFYSRWDNANANIAQTPKHP